jgi:processive rubber oxygenase RoxA-like protein
MVKQILWWLVIIAIVLTGYYVWTHRFGVPESFVDPGDDFRYGSVGSDHPMALAPIPYWLMKALPEVAPPSEVIPGLGAGAWNEQEGFAAFGLVTEAQMPKTLANSDAQPHLERPIGFSRRTVFGMDFIGVNCAFCHLSTYRDAPGGKLKNVLAGTGNAVNIEQFFLYMFKVLPELDAAEVMNQVKIELEKQNQSMGWFQRFIYRYIAIPIIPKILKARQNDYFDFITPGKSTRLNTFGPGRVDTWAAYKRLYLDPQQRNKVQGIVDFPPFWNLKARENMLMHWDGNIGVPVERNVVSALAVIGERLDYLDFAHIERIADFAEELMPPRFEDRVPKTVRGIQHDLVENGERLFQSRCAVCHAPDGDRIGTVERIEDIGTDVQRHLDFSPELANGLNQLGTDQWELRNFAPQHGYVNNLLDGIWLRAPYLHNGSVPTLRDLLKKPGDRPTIFCRGDTVIDWDNVGYVSGMSANDRDKPCGKFYLYDTAVTGNSNSGHVFGTDLDEGEKNAVIEFLKTL